MSRPLCPVCDSSFKDGERIVAVMMSEYKDIDSEVHYAIKQPTTCIEIIHVNCYGPEFYQEETPIEN